MRREGGSIFNYRLLPLKRLLTSADIEETKKPVLREGSGFLKLRLLPELSLDRTGDEAGRIVQRVFPLRFYCNRTPSIRRDPDAFSGSLW
jgi:hypothetical protein